MMIRRYLCRRSKAAALVVYVSAIWLTMALTSSAQEPSTARVAIAIEPGTHYGVQLDDQLTESALSKLATGQAIAIFQRLDPVSSDSKRRTQVPEKEDLSDQQLVEFEVDDTKPEPAVFFVSPGQKFRFINQENHSFKADGAMAISLTPETIFYFQQPSRRLELVVCAKHGAEKTFAYTLCVSENPEKYQFLDLASENIIPSGPVEIQIWLVESRRWHPFMFRGVARKDSQMTIRFTIPQTQ